jgi:ABC-type Fe3+-hydroxamate transport system substrate-binding protein
LEQVQSAYPKRIVSLVPSLTEILVQLGCADRLVGVTRQCAVPREFEGDVEEIGGAKTLNLQKIVLLNPDLVLVNREDNRRTDIERLTNVVKVHSTFPRTAEQSLQMIAELGEILGIQSEARLWTVRAKHSLFSLWKHVKERRPLKAACLIWENPWMTVNKDTYIHDLLSLGGFKNVFAGRPERYTRVTLDEIRGINPEVILFPCEPFRFTEQHLEKFRHFQECEAVIRDNLFLIPGEPLNRPGARMHQAVELMKDLSDKCHAEDR